MDTDIADHDNEDEEGIEAVEEYLVIGEVVVDTKRVLNESVDRTDQDSSTGRVDNAKEQWPVGVCGERFIPQSCPQHNCESDASDDEEPEASKLNSQSSQNEILSLVLLVYCISACNYSSSNGLYDEAQDVEANKERSNSSSGHPEMSKGLIFGRHNPQENSTECHVTGGGHDSRRNKDEDCLDDEDVLVVKVLYGHGASSKPNQFH